MLMLYGSSERLIVQLTCDNASAGENKALCFVSANLTFVLCSLQKVDSLLGKLAAVTDEMMSIRFEEDAFSTIQKRHIYSVYGSTDQAETMFQALLSNPQEALPVVRERLVSKGSEWAKVCFPTHT